MKKLCAVLCACALVLSGCSALVRGFANGLQQGMRRAEATPAVYEGKGTLGDFEVEIISAEAVKSFEGKPAVAVTYQWKNNSDRTESFMSAMEDEVFQDGIQLQSTIPESFADDREEFDIGLNVKPGKALIVTEAYELRGETKTIEVEVTVFSVYGQGPVVKKTFTLD